MTTPEDHDLIHLRDVRCEMTEHLGLEVVGDGVDMLRFDQ